jgi:hypothetical protein
MATDWWPQEEGYIVEGTPVVMCYAGAHISEMSCVVLDAATAGRVCVAHSAGAGDSLGVALRAASAGQMVPVAFGGIVKLIANAAIGLGVLVQSLGSDTPNITVTGNSVSVQIGDQAGTRVLGTSLQEATAGSDEILVCLGMW